MKNTPNTNKRTSMFDDSMLAQPDDDKAIYVFGAPAQIKEFEDRDYILNKHKERFKEFKVELNKQFSDFTKKQIEDGQLKGIKFNKRTTIHLGRIFEKWLEVSLAYALVGSEDSDQEYLLENKTKICENIIKSGVIRPVEAGMYQNGRRYLYGAGARGGILGAIYDGILRFIMIPVNWVLDYNTVKADDIPKSALSSSLYVDPRQIIDQIGQINTHPVESLPPAALIGNYIRNCAIANRAGLPFDMVPKPDSVESLYKGGHFVRYDVNASPNSAARAISRDQEDYKIIGNYSLIRNVAYLTDKDINVTEKSNVDVIDINGKSFVAQVEGKSEILKEKIAAKSFVEKVASDDTSTRQLN